LLALPKPGWMSLPLVPGFLMITLPAWPHAWEDRALH
jgi:hypothetical protein